MSAQVQAWEIILPRFQRTSARVPAQGEAMYLATSKVLMLAYPRTDGTYNLCALSSMLDTKDPHMFGTHVTTITKDGLEQIAIDDRFVAKITPSEIESLRDTIQFPNHHQVREILEQSSPTHFDPFEL
jgi:hypothetical protein